ncbi:DUF3888 domain-containing protein [Bacillaceae bacterium CLA-AA-H227]|uniref:DUF3888 domain-containing protein n=1 Tax=Robertmurraya yapensis (ex Hitch et al 2024) TaxID=3133160 RepID=A0ACC6SEI1_9BACI
MKKIVAIFMIGMLLVISNTTVNAKTINEADTELCETLKYALINTLRQPVDKAITEIYKEDKNAPEGLTWASYDTEILKIKQLYGVGGVYEGQLISYKHIKTYR